MNLKTGGGTAARLCVDQQRTGCRAAASGNIGATATLDGTQSAGAGTLDQTFNLTYADDSTLAGALGNLGTQAITVTGKVYGHAGGSASGTTIALPDSIVGYMGSLAAAGSATISNAAGFRVNLKTTGGTAAGYLSINNVQGVAPATSANIGAMATLDGTQSAGAGSLNQAFNLTYADDSTLPGAVSNLGTQTISVTGNVYDHASGSASGTTITLPDSIVGYIGSLAAAGSATISNAAGFRVNLKTSGGTAAGYLSINNVQGVAPATSENSALRPPSTARSLPGPDRSTRRST